MTRFLLALLLAALALAAVSGAQAKAPPSGIDVCGASGCLHLAFQQSEALWTGGHEVGRPLRVPAPFFVLRWTWGPSQPEQTAYYVPTAGALRWPNASGDPATWMRVGPATAAMFDAATRGLSPYPVTAPTAVTVGTKQARGPETYLRLLEGRDAGIAPVTLWVTVRMRSDPMSPWTDDRAVIRISARGRSRLVLVDGWVHRVPLWVANRARRGLPLTP
jgi:hypothetical protein